MPQDTIRPPVIREQGVPNPGRLIARLAASTSSWWSGPAADANQALTGFGPLSDFAIYQALMGQGSVIGPFQR